METYRVRFVLSFCLFIFPQMCKAEWGGSPACWWFGLYFCLLFRWGILHRVLLVAGWCQVLYSSSFLCVSSHYVILPTVSSLVVYGLGVSAPTSQAQGLISGQQRRFHKWFAMALSEIKTNIQKWETKDEPQTNGSYKIRQIIIKIMEYTHKHIHPWAKSDSPTKIKYSRLTQWTKEIKNYT